MATFVLVPGAGGQAWYWHRLVPELEARGHDAIAVELPAADPRAGLADYADTVVAAIGDHADDRRLVMVAQSMGATRFIQGRDDRFFPIEFQRRVVKQRLGIELDGLRGGHLLALSQPVALADKLVEYTR